MALQYPCGRWLIWLLPLLGVGWTVMQAPAWLEPYRITVHLQPGQSVVLGREALAALQADSEHLRVRRDAEDRWWLANISPSKQVLWQPNGRREERQTREWPLMAGATFTLGAQSAVVLSAQPGHLVIEGGGRHWDYDGFNLRLAGQLLPECFANWRTAFRQRLGHLPSLGRWLQRPLRLGGGVYCADRLGLAGVPVDTALIAPTDSGFVLRPGVATGQPHDLPVIVAANTPDAESLWLRSIPLTVGDGLIVGRTGYRVTQTAPALELTLLTRAWRGLAGTEWSMPSAVTLDKQPIAWLWPPDPIGWAWPLGLGLSLLIIGLVWYAGDGRRAVALGLAGVCLGLHVNSPFIPILWPYLLAWLALGIGLMRVRSRWSVRLLAALTVLFGLGWMTLLQLAVGAGESGWSRYGSSNAALVGAFGWLLWANCHGDGRLSTALIRKRLPQTLWLLSGTAIGCLMMQVLWGDESGWAGFQPFELAQLALVMTAAYALASPSSERVDGWRLALQRLRTLSPVLLLAVTSGFALTFLRDFSPLVLLVILAVALLWAWVRIHPQPVWRGWGRLLVLTLILSAVAGLAWLYQQPERFPLDFQADRIRVWADPEQYPHAGYQLRRALEAIRAGGWWGTVWADSANGRIMALPAVEDDFMPAFFLHRYGGLAALFLAGIQAAFIAILLTIADHACRPLPLTRLHRFVYFTLYGGAALLAGHFVVSWGANLGFLPVMGQPMSLLSAAGSHLTLFVLPIVTLAVAVEEKIDDHSPGCTHRV